MKYLSDNESKTDQVFYCGRPGVPRIGPPRKIVQLPNEIIFLSRTSFACESVLLRRFGGPLGGFFHTTAMHVTERL